MYLTMKGTHTEKKSGHRFCAFERPETKFASVEELKNQVMRDIRSVKNIFKKADFWIYNMTELCYTGRGVKTAGVR